MSAPSEEETRLEGERANSVGAYHAALGDRDGKLAHLHRTKGPGGSRWLRLEKKLSDGDEKCRAIFAKLRRVTDGKRFPNWLALIAAVILAVLEAPINKFHVG